MSPHGDLTGGPAAPVARPPGTWVAALAVAAVIVHVSVLYWPRPVSVGSGLSLDKLVHVIVFAVPVVLVALWRGRVWLVAAVFGAHAIVSELVQSLVLPNRHGDLGDGLADLVGVMLGILVWRVLTRHDR